MIPVSTVKTRSSRSPAMCCRTMPGRRFMMSPESWDELDDEVDELDTGERDDQAADAVDPQVPAEQRLCRGRPVAHAAQRQRDQRADDQRVEDDRRRDPRLRAEQRRGVELVPGR